MTTKFFKLELIFFQILQQKQKQPAQNKPVRDLSHLQICPQGPHQLGLVYTVLFKTQIIQTFAKFAVYLIISTVRFAIKYTA